MLIGKLDARQMLTVVRRLCDQSSIGPSGVPDQFFSRITRPISPPPTSQSAPDPAAAGPLRTTSGGVFRSVMVPRSARSLVTHARPRWVRRVPERIVA
ncbi:MAG: hypothetical protein ACT4O0_12755 [Pseudonocardia sp.]